MKTKLTLVITASVCFFFNTLSLADSWIQKMDLPSDGRGAPVAFAIGDYGYVGSGFNFDVGLTLADFWKYDPANDSWSQVADHGGGGIGGATAFVVDDIAYVVTGSDESSTKTTEMWAYDPSSNNWTQKTSLPGAARNYSTAFAIGGKGYVAAGYGNVSSLKDLWEYDPSTDGWAQKADVPGQLRSSAMAFSINDTGYIAGGYGAGPLNDFYAYDPATDTWTAKASIGIKRSDACAFVINGHGFICAGYTTLGSSIGLIEYDPATDTWATKASVIGGGKSNLIGFAINGLGYAGMGYDNLVNETKQLYEYSPDSSGVPTTITEVNEMNAVTIYPNPASDFVTVQIDAKQFSNSESVVSIISDEGRIVYEENILSGLGMLNDKLQLPFVADGLYFIIVTNGDKSLKSPLIISRQK